MVYLDNSATTKIYKEVYEDMLPYLMNEYGNPSSKYYEQALNAKSAIDISRKRVASLLSCTEEEIIFTSGSTESNNLILKGVADYYKTRGKHIITTAAEHPSVIETCNFLQGNGYEITFLNTDQYGRVSPEELEGAIRSDTILVSIMWGNNELGSLNDMMNISRICKNSEVFLHTDATQVIGKIDISITDFPGITFLSCSAHKFHGPKGVGCIFIKKDPYGILTPITPLFHGGGQEKGIRSGTHAVHNIVGMGSASKITSENLEANIEHIKKNEEYLTTILVEKFGDSISFNSDRMNKIPGIINVRFKGVNNELLLKQLAPLVSASTGSACSTSKPSHVLAAAGYTIDDIRSSIRFSMSALTTKEELDIFREL